MFKIVKESGLGTIWLPVTNGTTLYVNQMVTTSQGFLAAFGAATGTPTTSRPLGIVVATNNKTPTYSSTYNAHYITGVQTQAAQLARSWQGAQGMWSVGDPIPMVQVELIGKDTVIQGTFGGALTAFNPADASSTGAAITKSETSQGTVDYNTIFYCRSGANKGIYRVNGDDSNNGSKTTSNFPVYWPYGVAVTDYYVRANVTLGLSKVQFDSLSMYVDPTNALSAYYNIIVEEVNLSTSGLETVTFRFA
jgi:hypothetical protein